MTDIDRIKALLAGAEKHEANVSGGHTCDAIKAKARGHVEAYRKVMAILNKEGEFPDIEITV